MMKATEIRELTRSERDERLQELRHDLMQERGIQAMGGSAQSPGKIRTLRREIARILTINREEELA